VLAAVGLATIKRIEAAPDIRGAADTFWRLQAALEGAGVEFIPAEAPKGPGVRLRKMPRLHPKSKGKRRGRQVT
jgi:hypothetical protein